jgi:UDP-N-acetylmuramyl pentapeptide phosphotransferase/UDP-N-acetylglucosamine-1-phosphate transferase
MLQVPGWGLASLAVGTALLSAVLVRRFCNPRSIMFVLDHPNPRSMHTQPVPRTGGVAILVSILAGALATVHLLGRPPGLEWVAAGALTVSFVSFLDDRFGLSAGLRILVHLGAAAVALLGGFRLDRLILPGVSWIFPPGVAEVLTVLFVAWMINLYNFMDGMDGLAGGMALVGFGTYAVLGWNAGQPRFMMVSLVVAAAAGGFLILNYPPARIFMGDCGSSLLGFLSGMLALWADREKIFPLVVGVLIFSPFIIDATVTLLRRTSRGEKPWVPHRSHCYQRLALSGWTPKRTLLVEYALMIACAASGLVYGRLSDVARRVLLLSWILIYAVLFMGVGWVEFSKKRLTKEI